MKPIDKLYMRYLALDNSRLCGQPHNRDMLWLCRLELDVYYNYEGPEKLENGFLWGS